MKKQTAARAQQEERAGACRTYILGHEALMHCRADVRPLLAKLLTLCLPLRQACCAPMRRWSDPGKASRPYRRQQAHGLDSLFQDMLSQLAVAEAPSVQPTIFARAPSLAARLRAASRALPLAARLRNLSRAAMPRRRQTVVSAQGSGSGSFSDMGDFSGSGSSLGFQVTPLVTARPARASLQAQLQAQAQARAKHTSQSLGAGSGTAQHAGGPRAQEQADWRMTAKAGAHVGGGTANDQHSLSSGGDELWTGVDVLKAGHAGLRPVLPQPRATAPDQLQAELLCKFRDRKAAAELPAGAPQQAGSASGLATQHAWPAVKEVGASSPLGHASHATSLSLQERMQGERRARAGRAGQDLVEHTGHVPAAQPGPAALSLQAQLQANFQARAERARRAPLKAEGVTAASTPAASTSSGPEIASALGYSDAAHAFQDQLQASLRQLAERAKKRGAAAAAAPSPGASTNPGEGRRGAEAGDRMQGGGSLQAQPEPLTRQGFADNQQATKAQHVAIGRPARRA